MLLIVKILQTKQLIMKLLNKKSLKIKLFRVILYHYLLVMIDFLKFAIEMDQCMLVNEIFNIMGILYQMLGCKIAALGAFNTAVNI